MQALLGLGKLVEDPAEQQLAYKLEEAGYKHGDQVLISNVNSVENLVDNDTECVQHKTHRVKGKIELVDLS